MPTSHMASLLEYKRAVKSLMSDGFSKLKDSIQELTQKVLDEQMKDKEYKGDQVKGWSENVIRSILQELGKEEYQPYKYLANCLVLSKRSNGVHTVTMSLWDPQNDGSVTTQWSNDTMQVIVTIWGMKY